MSQSVDTTFSITSWDEQPCHDAGNGPRLTRALVRRVYRGDLAGESLTQYAMVHRPDGSAEFTGYERFLGSLCGRTGSFVLRHDGTFVKGVATTAWSVVLDSGGGSLQGMSGAGEYSVGHAEEYAIQLDLRRTDL